MIATRTRNAHSTCYRRSGFVVCDDYERGTIIYMGMTLPGDHGRAAGACSVFLHIKWGFQKGGVSEEAAPAAGRCLRGVRARIDEAAGLAVVIVDSTVVALNSGESLPLGLDDGIE